MNRVSRAGARASSPLCRGRLGKAGARSFLWVAALGVTLGACGDWRFGPPCQVVQEYLCQRESPEYCEKAKAWLETRLVDDDGNPLEGEARTQMCAAIDKTPELRNAYRFKAEQIIKGTPHLDLSKPARDRRLLKFGKGPLAEKQAAEAKAAGDADAKAK